jgi:hypothetical protein
VTESIAREVAERVPSLSEADTESVANAIVGRARELLFPNWWNQTYMDTELYRELTVVLATQFRDLGLHGTGTTFVDRCIRLLRKVRFVGAAGE